MGINFAKRVLEYYDFCWSYSGFNQFRGKLADEIGLKLDEMCGFGGYKNWPSSDPIVPLLNHSDCEGNLSPSNCETVYPRLLELIEKWPNDDYDKQQAKELAVAMKDCASEGCYLEFV